MSRDSITDVREEATKRIHALRLMVFRLIQRAGGSEDHGAWPEVIAKAKQVLENTDTPLP